MNLPQNESNKIRELIYSSTGIFIREDKTEILSRRVNARMEQLGLKTARDYYRYLALDMTGKEEEELINLIIVPETYFFRDYTQLQLFAEEVLPLIIAEKQRRKNRRLSMLSGGCSTGEEPYTLAIILREMLDNVDEWDIKIDAVDINRVVIEHARAGIYRERSLRETPYLYRNSYFTKESDTHILSPVIKEMVAFRRLNLLDRAQMSTLSSYDVVFCRNVLIYFDRASAGKVMEHFYTLMNPGAFIFMGSAESAGRLTDLFQSVRMKNSFVYGK